MEAHHVSAEEVRLFLQRISRSLAERPLDLDPGTHREKVAGLLRINGEASHYEFLGVELVAKAMEIHEGFERTARLVHPGHAARLGLAGREGVLEVLFERATLAYLTLSNPESRKAYDRDLDPQARAALVAAITPVGDATRDLARGYYQRACSLVDAEDYHFAVELLQQAVKIDPRGEYFSLLGRIQARNPQWLQDAAVSLQRAIDLKTPDSSLPDALEEVKRLIATGEASDEEMEISLVEVEEEDDEPKRKPAKRAAAGGAGKRSPRGKR
jgi:tetratricopeptide (TPR) repeat protein